jgi:hypothetical protein
MYFPVGDTSILTFFNSLAVQSAESTADRRTATVMPDEDALEGN